MDQVHFQTPFSNDIYFDGLFPGSTGTYDLLSDRTCVQSWGLYIPFIPIPFQLIFLVAQLVKNPPAMWETCIRSLGWEDHLEKEKAIQPSILAWRIPWTI